MNKSILKRLVIGVLALVLLGAALVGYEVNKAIEKARSEDPTVWQDEMDAFVAASNNGKAPENAIVFVGSSSIRFWTSLKEDMAPLPVIQRGFGSAKMNDVTYYAEELVSINNPRAIVVFVGANDISTRHVKPAATILESYKAFVSKVRSAQPNLPIYYILITPTVKRWPLWPFAQETNGLISAFMSTHDNMYVIDTGPSLLGADGTPNPEMFRRDGLHLSEEGYAQWTRIIKSRLLADFPIEQSKN